MRKKTKNKQAETEALLIIGNASNASTIRYASGFSLVDPVVYFQNGRERWLVVPALEVGRAASSCPDVQVVTPSELPIDRDEQRRLNGWAYGVLKHTDTIHTRVQDDFPIGTANELEQRGIRITIDDEPAFPQRLVKSRQEIDCIRDAQKAASASMKTAVSLIRQARVNRKGELVHSGSVLTADRVRFEIQKVLLEHNCIDAMDTIVACGADAADPHERGSGPLRSCETIVIDIFPQNRVTGYWGDITRTVLKGKATPHQKKMYASVKKAQALALSMLKPGIKGETIHRAVAASMKKDGFETKVEENRAEGFFHGTGHGVGLDIHEQPSLSLRPGRLKAGCVVTVEPGLYYTEHGGVRIEDTVVITKTGYRMLASCPIQFELR